MHRVEVVRLILLIFFCIPRSLNECRLRFISVTSSLAGAERADATPDEHARFAADVKKVIDAFFEQTSWCPNRVKPVAGALLYTKYNFLIRFVMKRIARRRQPTHHAIMNKRNLQQFFSQRRHKTPNPVPV